MARPLWSGSLSFGLIRIPVSLGSIVRHREVQFHELHAGDHGRIREQLICERDGKIVTRDQVVRGFLRSDGSVIVISNEELDHFLSKKNRSITLETFVSVSDIDPLYFDHSYALLAEEDGRTAYSLFRNALVETKTVGIATIVLREKTYLCIIRPIPRGLLLTTLLYGDEIVRLPAQAAPQTQLSKREKESARAFIEANIGTFNPSTTHDRSRERLENLLARKRPSRLPLPPPIPTSRRATTTKNFTRLLEESLRIQKRNKSGETRKKGLKKRLPRAK